MIYNDSFGQGKLIIGDAFCNSVNTEIQRIGKFKLIICDPPYGDIVKESWDRHDYFAWMSHCEHVSDENCTIAMWGGIGKFRNRPFLDFASSVETHFPQWRLLNWITWSKKRAYGVKDNYLFTREECLILQKGNPVFHIPLLEEKRGYAGYNAKYPAKSEFLRRTNVWTDITELFRGKIHPCQKPDKLYEIIINTHSDLGDIVYDPCAGSLTTMRAAAACSRKFLVVERETKYVNNAINNTPWKDRFSYSVVH